MARTKRSKNICLNCKNTWYPRGRSVSRECPSCGSNLVQIAVMDFPTWLVTGGLGLIILVIGLSWSPLLTILVLILGVALFFIVKNRRENEAEEERISIMNAEQDRMNARKQYLLNKFSDPSLVQRVLDRNIELGDSKQFVLEAFGYPAAIDNDVLKTKTREILKYKKGNEARTNQYNIQIKLENDIVVGWEDKN